MRSLTSIARCIATFGLIAFGISACTDKAKDNYAKCVQLDSSGDVGGAWQACNDAVGDDPTSKSGKAASTKLTEMKPRYDKWKADQAANAAAAAEEQRKQDEANAKAAASARAVAIASAKAKVQKRYDGTDRDGQCVDQSLPAYRWHYEGGSRDEIDLVANADGCSHLFPGRTDFMLFKVFCCPTQPNPF